MQQAPGSKAQRALTTDEKALVEQGARAALAGLAAAALQGGKPVMEWQHPGPGGPTQPAVPRLLDMALQTTEQKWGDAGAGCAHCQNGKCPRDPAAQLGTHFSL